MPTCTLSSARSIVSQKTIQEIIYDGTSTYETKTRLHYRLPTRYHQDSGSPQLCGSWGRLASNIYVLIPKYYVRTCLIRAFTSDRPGTDSRVNTSLGAVRLVNSRDSKINSWILYTLHCCSIMFKIHSSGVLPLFFSLYTFSICSARS